MEKAVCIVDLNKPPKPITYERLQELMKERDDMENNDLLWTETKEIIKEATRLAQIKEDLRVALNEAGFPIPNGLKMIDWIPIIKEVRL